MARISRKNYTSNFLHLIIKGINGEYIFKNSIFITTYKSILKKYIKQYNINIIAYCFMSNHLHLLVYSENIISVSCFMKSVNTMFAIKYNKFNNRIGYVFNNRFFSQSISNPRQLLICIAYIHFNPVKSQLVEHPSKYKYSSFNSYFNSDDLLSTNGIKLAFQTNSINEIKQLFYLLHNNYSPSMFKKLGDLDKINDNYYLNIIEKYLLLYNLNIEEITKSDNKFKILLSDLRINTNLSIRQLGNIFNVSKYKIEKLIK